MQRFSISSLPEVLLRHCIEIVIVVCFICLLIDKYYTQIISVLVVTVVAVCVHSYEHRCQIDLQGFDN